MTRIIIRIILKVSREICWSTKHILYIFHKTMKLINNLQLLFFLLSLNKSYKITKSEENIYLTINDFNNKDLIKIYISFIIFNIILLK